MPPARGNCLSPNESCTLLGRFMHLLFRLLHLAWLALAHRGGDKTMMMKWHKHPCSDQDSHVPYLQLVCTCSLSVQGFVSQARTPETHGQACSANKPTSSHTRQHVSILCNDVKPVQRDSRCDAVSGSSGPKLSRHAWALKKQMTPMLLLLIPLLVNC